MAIPVKLEAFEGPLDLLLHLIEKNKIDIYDIPIVTITEQYLDYVKAMETENMDVMSEFMIMAATLIDIKCRMLLPKEVEEAEEDMDPREELVQRLLEYKKYKFMALVLRDQMEDTGNVLTRKQELPREVVKYRPPVDTEELLRDVTLESLLNIYNEILGKFEEKIDRQHRDFGKIEKEKISLGDRMMSVQKRVIKERKVSFRKLLENQPSREKIIVTFLAILELIHFDKIEVKQDESFGEIIIESKEPEGTEVRPFNDLELEM